ncbi:hypothetical protein EMIT0194P_260065 [Pseudomonas serbica]
MPDRRYPSLYQSIVSKSQGAIQIREQSWTSLSDLTPAYPHNGICDGLSICVQRFHCRYRISGDTADPIF